ncbi:MAG TPA: class I SAM-dependent methyltransferase [Phycisphaerales bacterium]|nr:class I SAM-dependent methyltransferase [Phycisphaerales bacterium]
MKQVPEAITNTKKTGSDRQREHYDVIHDAYEDHYYDEYSMSYRKKHIFAPLFNGLTLENKTIAELACGNGATSKELLRTFPSVDVLGFDISAPACKAYEQEVGRPCYELDLTSDTPPTNCCDIAVVVGGLHHCVCDLPNTIKNIASMVKPNGYLLMVEPNADFLLEFIRKRWYKADHYFDDETEKALSHEELMKIGRHWFKCVDIKYKGGPGYFLILNSLLFRLPKWAKRLIARPLIFIDSLYDVLPFKMASPFFIARWQRLEGVESSSGSTSNARAEGDTRC